MHVSCKAHKTNSDKLFQFVNTQSLDYKIEHA